MHALFLIGEIAINMELVQPRYMIMANFLVAHSLKKSANSAQDNSLISKYE
jgi:hypothetical protein